MTLFNRILLLAVALLMAAGLGEYAALRATRAKLAGVEASLTAAQTEMDGLRRSLKSTNAALSVRAKALAAAQVSVARAHKDLDHALQANPGWAAAAVPDAVWMRLYGPPAGPASGATH